MRTEELSEDTATHLQNANASKAGTRPAWMSTILNSIFVLPGPGRAWLTANSSWNCQLDRQILNQRAWWYSASTTHSLFINPALLHDESLV